MAKSTVSREPRLDSLLAPRKGIPLVSKVLGRPVKFDDKVVKATVTLFLRQVVDLDKQALKIRASSGRVIDRADIIRAVLDAVQPWKMDLSGCQNEEDVKAKIREAFRG